MKSLQGVIGLKMQTMVNLKYLLTTVCTNHKSAHN